MRIIYKLKQWPFICQQQLISIQPAIQSSKLKPFFLLLNKQLQCHLSHALLRFQHAVKGSWGRKQNAGMPMNFPFSPQYKERSMTQKTNLFFSILHPLVLKKKQAHSIASVGSLIPSLLQTFQLLLGSDLLLAQRYRITQSTDCEIMCFLKEKKSFWVLPSQPQTPGDLPRDVHLLRYLPGTEGQRRSS